MLIMPDVLVLARELMNEWQLSVPSRAVMNDQFYGA